MRRWVVERAFAFSNMADELLAEGWEPFAVNWAPDGDGGRTYMYFRFELMPGEAAPPSKMKGGK